MGNEQSAFSDAVTNSLLYESNVETVTRSAISGWVWRTDKPDAPLKVEAVLGDQVVGSTIADILRQDLAEAKNSSGKHGFLLTFDPPLTGETAPVVRLADEPKTPLSGSLDRVLPPADEPAPAVADPLYESNVETVTRSAISGWVWRADRPDASLRIEAVVGERVVGSTIADIMRQDLANAKKGSGRHGFLLTFEPPLTGETAPVVRLADAPKAPLWGSLDRDFAADDNGIEIAKPKPPQPQFQGAVDYVSKKKTVGWVWDANAPDLRLTVEAVLDGKRIAEARGDAHREDLLLYGKGDGAYGFALEYEQADIGRRDLQVRVVGAEYKVAIPKSAYVEETVSAPAPAAKSKLEKRPVYEFHVDAMTRRSAHGWTWCPENPEQEIVVEALLDNQVIGRTRANAMRPDLLKYGKGTGRYGFTLAFNKFLTGEEAPILRIAPEDAFHVFDSAKLPPLSQADRKRIEQANIEGLVAEHMLFTQRGPEFEEAQSQILAALKPSSDVPKPLVIAFYLPQFHAIAENDRFWGKGFTEWRQLARALPRFPGHYQPRIPRDLGFYELGASEILRKQAKMALDAGVGAFCYYYYWFNGRKVLERPLDAHRSSDIDMPFLIMWANENWTKTWDGFEDNVLLRQDYRDEDEDALLADLASHFDDRRYVRLDGRPLFIVYNIRHIPDAEVTIQRWRDKLETRHGHRPLMFMAQAFTAKDPRPFGLDGAIEFPPHKLASPHPGRDTPDAYSKEFAGRVIAYDDFVATSTQENPPDYPLIKTAVPSWDNDARRPNRGLVLEGVAPRKYEAWIRELVQGALDHPVHGVPVLAINAWNEWAEAAYLEPDVYFGAAFLNATARGVVAGVNSYAPADRRRNNKLAVTVVMPCYNHARFLPERIESVLNQYDPPAEIVFLDDCSTDDSVVVAERLLSQSSIPYKIIRNETNSGGVFRQWIKGLSHASHELIWIAETDDSADRHFLSHILPAFDRDDVLAAFGYIQCIDQEGGARDDLKSYFDGMRGISWSVSTVMAAATAFEYDFATRNIIPNASGLVFRKPQLSPEEIDRLTQYGFAGDWYFYALMLRGGSLAYCHKAKSYFRVNPQSASRSSFFGEKHLREHQMVLEDLDREFGVSDEALTEHCRKLVDHFSDQTTESLAKRFRAALGAHKRRPHICIVSHSFSVGGGEVLPLELANRLRSRGYHISYLVLERVTEGPTIRNRLRPDIPVFYWQDVKSDLKGFFDRYKIDVLNSHNVGVEIQLARIAKPVDIAWIVTLHGGYETVTDYIDEAFIRYVQNHVDRWFFIAEKNKQPLLTKGLRDEGFVRCFNSVPGYGVDWADREAFRAEHGIPQQAFCLMICSRAIPEKGWKTALEIAKAAGERTGRDVHVCFIGSGPLADELAASQADNPRVHVLGHIDNPMRTFRSFDLGIFPSVYIGESFPLFLLECFEAGLPVVATDIGEIPYIMSAEGETPGSLAPWTLPRADMVARMTDDVVAFLTDAEKLTRAVAAAKKTAARFNIDNMVDFYLGHAEDIICELRKPAV